MRRGDAVLFILAMMLFLFGLNYMVGKGSGQSPIKVNKLIQTLKLEKDSEFASALRKVTAQSKHAPKEESLVLPKDLFSNKLQHIRFLLSRNEYKEKACDFLESEIKTFDFKNQSSQSLNYLSEVYTAYFKVQKDSGKALEAYKTLESQLGNQPLVREVKMKLSNSYPEK
ncbi:MAG: hypothetical protein KDD45_03835 [Bdellovibrionales bacterium]|nr:hypothetical protein [Bdellovibrionales bacterium]